MYLPHVENAEPLTWCERSDGVAGVIAGIVSYIIAHFTTKGLDFLSSKTNGAFGWHNPHEDIDGPETREVTFRLRDNKAAAQGPGKISDASSEDSQNGKVGRLAATETTNQSAGLGDRNQLHGSLESL